MICLLLWCKAVKTLETGSEELSGNCLRFHKGPLGKHYHCITSHPQTDPLTTTTICLLTILHWQWTYRGSSSGLAWDLSWVCSHLVGWLKQDDLRWPHWPDQALMLPAPLQVMSFSYLMQSYLAAGACQEGHRKVAGFLRPKFWNMCPYHFCQIPLVRKQLTRLTQIQGVGKQTPPPDEGSGKVLWPCFLQWGIARLHCYQSTHPGNYCPCRDPTSIHLLLLPMGMVGRSIFCIGDWELGT